MDLLTVEEAARLLKISSYTVRRWLNEGNLPGTKIGRGRQWRIRKVDLLAYSGSQEDVVRDKPTAMSKHEIEELFKDLDSLAQEVGKYWPVGVSSVDAVRDARGRY